MDIIPELIRDILFLVPDHDIYPEQQFDYSKIKKYDFDTVKYHCEILTNRGFVESNNIAKDVSNPIYAPYKLTGVNGENFFLYLSLDGIFEIIASEFNKEKIKDIDHLYRIASKEYRSRDF